MIEREDSSTKSNCASCDLSIYCDVNKELFFDKNSELKPLSSAGVEAGQIIESIDREIKNVHLDEAYKEWKDRMVLRYAGDPEGLRRALESIDALYESTQVAQLQADISSNEFLEVTIDREIKYSEKSQAIDAALEIRDACEGPRTVKIGGFLSKRIVQVCGMEDTPEFSKIRELKLDDQQFLADNSY